MNCSPFHCAAVLAMLLVTAACADQASGSVAAPTSATRGTGEAPAPAAPAPEAVEQGVDQSTPASVPDPGNTGRAIATPPAQSMPVPEELYPVDPAPVPPPER